MKGLQYAIDLVDRTFGVTIKKAKASTQGLDNAVNKADKNMRAMGNTGKQSFSNIGRYAKSAAAAVGLVFAFSQAQAFASEIQNIGTQYESLENAISFASGSEAGKNFEFMNSKIDSLGLSIPAVYKGFATLAGSMRGTKLEGQATRDIFEGVAMASSAMGLSAANSEGVFLAIGQIASKGVVSMEELRQQLGERLPGVLKMAADAMGMPMDQLNKLIESGTLASDVFLPKLGKALKENFSEAAKIAANGLQGSVNRSDNALERMKKNISESTMGSQIAWNKFKEKVWNGISDMIPQLLDLGSSFGDLLKAAKPLWDTIRDIGDSMGTTEEFINGLKTAMEKAAPVVNWVAEGLAGVIEFVALAPELFAALAIAVWAVNVAMYANPIGFVVAVIMVLIVALGNAYRKVGAFRGSIMAIWTTLKGFSDAINMVIIGRFHQLLAGITGVAQAIKLVFAGEWKKAFQVGQKAKDELFSNKAGRAFSNKMKEVGMQAGKDYDKGLAEAAANANAPGLLEQIKNGALAPSANNKFLGDTDTELPTTPTAPTSTSVSGGGGSSTKHTTFNIKSMVQQLTVQTTNISGNPADLKNQLEKIFLELMGDLELRANS